MSRQQDFANPTNALNGSRNHKSDIRDVHRAISSSSFTTKNQINNNNNINVNNNLSNKEPNGLVNSHFHYGSNTEINNTLAAETAAADAAATAATSVSNSSRGNISKFLHNHLLKKDIKSKSKIGSSLGSLMQQQNHLRKSNEMLDTQLQQANLNATDIFNEINNQRIAQSVSSPQINPYRQHQNNHQQSSQVTSARPLYKQPQHQVPPQKATTTTTINEIPTSSALTADKLATSRHKGQPIRDADVKDRAMSPSNQNSSNRSHHHHHHQNKQQISPSTSGVAHQLSSSQKERNLNDLVIKDTRSGSTSSNNDPHLGSGFIAEEPTLDALGSLERELPVELSFLIRQQAYCMAKMNYLDRQIRELKEANKTTRVPSLGLTNNQQQQQQQQNGLIYQSGPIAMHQNQRLLNHNYHPAQHNYQALHLNNSSNNIINSSNVIGKNGNQFIASDDSGGEYSRATISDDDELSSLLDQIAKTVKTERNPVSHSMQMHQLQHQQQQQQLHHQHQLQQQQQQQQLFLHQQVRPGNYSILSNCQSQQAFPVLNQPYLHHQATGPNAMPVFLMSSPIAVAAAHPSSITSNILPGIHFQPETKYNQYYGDFLANNSQAVANMGGNIDASGVFQQHLRQQQQQQQQHSAAAAAATINGGLSGSKLQFDNSISMIEQLVAQKERRQIKSQLSSADNWLKMRTSSASGGGGGNLQRDLDGNKTTRMAMPNGGKTPAGNATGSQVDRKILAGSGGDVVAGHHRTASSASLSSASASAVSASPPINGDSGGAGTLSAGLPGSGSGAAAAANKNVATRPDTDQSSREA